MTMNKNTGKAYHGSSSGAIWLRFEGEMRCLAAPAVEEYLEQLNRNGEPGPVGIDLSGATLLDSTYLGILARLALRRGLGEVTLVSNRDEVNRTLKMMQFDRLFHITSTCPGIPGEWTPFPCQEPDEQQLRATVLEAHQALHQLLPDQDFDQVTLMIGKG